MEDTDRFILLASLWIVYTLFLLGLVWAAFTAGRALRLALHNTALNGPSRSFWPFGSSVESTDIVKCAATYGAVFRIPTGRFSSKIVICDPRAIAHFYANAPTIYRTPDSTREWTKNVVGCGLTWTDGEKHPSHRQALAPLFSASAVEGYCSVFFNTVQKVQHTWYKALQSRPRGMVIDIQHWMNSIVLDSIGIAGFGHDFESLRGDYCTVTAAFYTLRAPSTNSLADIIFRLAATTPLLRELPTAKNRIINTFHSHMSRIALDVLERNSSKDRAADKSLLGLLNLRVFNPEHAIVFRLVHFPGRICSHTRTGFETTATSLSWVLVELAQNPAIQRKLRHELLKAGNLPYPALAKLPFLHAVVNETLRLHPPVGATTRVAAQDDLIPLSAPILTRRGETVTSIRVGKGTPVVAPIRHLNTAEPFWGPGASSAKFDPGRWWQLHSNGSRSSGASGTEFPGTRHLAFGDGPRACIGKEFALALIKIVLSGIVGNFALALPEGLGGIVESPAGEGVPQPRVAGQGAEVLMVVRRL
ncbi:cytochrome P450 [Mycena filopes]|nr:cytochrome P450 [Mycena filopes]